MKRKSSGRSVAVSDEFKDFSRGTINGVSDAGRTIRHCRRVNNVEYDPVGALGVRRGYRDLIDYVLALQPHSLMDFYSDAGNKLFAAAGTKVYLVSDTLGYVEQTMPNVPTSAKWSFCNINGILIACQEDGANPPVLYDGTSWLAISMPTPGAAPTLAAAAGGSVDAGTHNFRIRWNFRNGSSLVSASAAIVVAGPNFTVNLTAIPISARTDYLGFTVERTKAADAATWYEDGVVVNAAATTYSATSSDASLGRIVPAAPGPYGQAPTSGGKYFAGVTAFQGRLLGWIGSTMYCSRALGDAETGAGILNFHPAANFPVGGDDGAPIWAVAQQVDRLVIGKYLSSIHVLQGFSPDDFQLIQVYGGAGPASTRGMCADSSRVWFYAGGDRLFLMDRNGTRRAAKIEMGEYLKEIAPAYENNVILKNVLGERVCLFYTATQSTYNEDAIVYRFDLSLWTHWRDLRVADLVVRKKASEFAGARVIVADPKQSAASSAAAFGSYSSHTSWLDQRVFQVQFYLQRVNTSGVAQWTANGVLASALTGDASFGTGSLPVPDGTTGGTFLIFYGRDGSGFTRARIQKFNAAGVAQWTAGGILISHDTNYIQMVSAFPDGAGGIMVAYCEGSALFFQRFNTAGAAQWAPAAGVVGDTPTASPEIAMWAPDGLAGAWLISTHYNNPNTNAKLLRIDGSGAARAGFVIGGNNIANSTNRTPSGSIATDGRLFMAVLDTAPALYARIYNLDGTIASSLSNFAPGFYSLGSPLACADDAGGGLIIYTDQALSSDLYRRRRIARFSNTCALLWTITLGSVLVTDVLATQRVQAGDGGVILVWQDRSSNNGTSYTVYAQKINKSGYIEWTSTVVAFTAAGGTFSCVGDGVGGVIIYYSYTPSTNEVYGQRLDSKGVPLWGSGGGVQITNVTGNQTSPAAAYTGVVGDAIPVGSAPGYHLWSALDGFADERTRLATTGKKIKWLAELPEYDGGDRDVDKDWNRLGVTVSKGNAAISASVRVGDATTSVPLQAAIPTAVWGGDPAVEETATLYFAPDTGAIEHVTTWAGEKPVAASAGIASGTVGSRASVVLAADLDDDFILTSVVLDYTRLPDRSYSEA